MAKDLGLRIRVERSLREAFLEVCRIQDKPAAQVIREFMRGYIAQHTSGTDGARTKEPAGQPNRHRIRSERKQATEGDHAVRISKSTRNIRNTGI